MLPIKCVLLSLIVCLNANFLPAQSFIAPFANFSSQWKEPIYEAAITASNAGFMSAREQGVIHVLNLIRLNPPLFAKTVLLNHSKNMNYVSDADSPEFKSLVETLLRMKPLPLLHPDSLAWVSAKCHAETSGLAGYLGHNRQSETCKKVTKFNGECCHYGYNDPLKIVISLLIDRGVPSLGHRKICLGQFSRIGVSFKPHKTYDTNVVLDFLN